MRAVGIKTLKNKLSEYVRLAAAGETVLISDRGIWWWPSSGPPRRAAAVTLPTHSLPMRSAAG